MKFILFLVFIFLCGPVEAEQDSRYLDAGKVLYENPLEQDVLKVNTSFGFCTILEFFEKPMLVTVGDNSLIQVEIPQKSNTVVVKPLQQMGQTNLFVYTPSQRFNYNVVISNAAQVDYVIDSKQTKLRSKASTKLSIGKLLKMVKSYDALKKLRAIDDREFLQKNVAAQCPYPQFNIEILEAFTNKNPHYLVLHIVIRNLSDEIVTINEKNAKIFVNDQKFIPQYILFDHNRLLAKDKTEGWIVLENSYVSIDNKFSINVDIEDKTYVCK